MQDCRLSMKHHLGMNEEEKMWTQNSQAVAAWSQGTCQEVTMFEST